MLAGRRVNQSVSSFIAQKTVKELIHLGRRIRGARVLILGLTFKENCPDLRNTRVIDIVSELKEYGVDPLVHDPYADPKEAFELYGMKLLKDFPSNSDAVIVAVAHDKYLKLSPESLRKFFTPNGGLLIDVKSAFRPKAFEEFKEIRYWSL